MAEAREYGIGWPVIPLTIGSPPSPWKQKIL